MTMPNSHAVDFGKGLPSAMRKPLPNKLVSQNEYAKQRVRAHELGRGIARLRATNPSALFDGTESPARVESFMIRWRQKKSLNDAVVGKADEVEELPIPEWARASFAPSRPVVANPLDMYAGARMMAFGGNNMRGKINWPWRRDRMARGGYEYVQGRAMTYAPLGGGRSYG